MPEVAISGRFVHQEIHTTAELSAVPDDAIIVADGCAYQSSGIQTLSTDGSDSWYCEVPLPAVVVWLPDAMEVPDA